MVWELICYRKLWKTEQQTWPGHQVFCFSLSHSQKKTLVSMDCDFISIHNRYLTIRQIAQVTQCAGQVAGSNPLVTPTPSLFLLPSLFSWSFPLDLLVLFKHLCHLETSIAAIILGWFDWLVYCLIGWLYKLLNDAWFSNTIITWCLNWRSWSLNPCCT